MGKCIFTPLTNTTSQWMHSGILSSVLEVNSTRKVVPIIWHCPTRLKNDVQQWTLQGGEKIAALPGIISIKVSTVWHGIHVFEYPRQGGRHYEYRWHCVHTVPMRHCTECATLNSSTGRRQSFLQVVPTLHCKPRTGCSTINRDVYSTYWVFGSFCRNGSCGIWRRLQELVWAPVGSSVRMISSCHSEPPSLNLVAGGISVFCVHSFILFMFA